MLKYNPNLQQNSYINAFVCERAELEIRKLFTEVI